ncbi:MAG: NUDIX hydrolase [Tenericutes bacterium]|nr:NUDIX hydrolase [Mycoplasmatota bacterium]
MIEKKKSSRKIYECSFLELYEDQVVLSNDKVTQRVYIKHPGGAAVLPIRTDGKIILTKQFRYPVGHMTIEIPAGKKDDQNEDGLTCAKRELEEETGYVSTDFKHIYTLHPCLGYSDEALEIFVALNCVKKENPITSDEDEFIETLYLDKKEVSTLLASQTITDGKTIIALQYYLLNL